MTVRPASARRAVPFGGTACAAAVGLLLLAAPGASGLPADLLSRVSSLGLGEDGFVLGSVPDADRLDAMERSDRPDTYPGTVQYCRDGLCVVVATETGVVMALYRRIAEPDAGQARDMIGRLMARHGEPTAEAHGELVYWAYGTDGRIDGAAWEADRGVGRLEVLATVKFRIEGGFAAAEAGEGSAPPGSIYYIITSDRLLESFAARD